ncbi:MAG: hypothetical protein K6U00_05290, partial [Armatimonadetes bacterium]|nr:hypothetical protein [Armatimonadota bacterium]
TGVDGGILFQRLMKELGACLSLMCLENRATYGGAPVDHISELRDVLQRQTCRIGCTEDLV